MELIRSFRTDIGDIGFHEETTTISTPRLTSAKAAVTIGPTDPTLLGDPHKQLNQETNFFAQPGILTGEVGGGGSSGLVIL